MIGAGLLIVDDDRATLDVAARILGPHYAVEVASDAEEARAKLTLGAIDLLLCDIRLPGESGMELVESVLNGGEDVAVAMVVGEDSPELAEKAFEIGVYGYLVKPYRRGDLLFTVRNALQRKELERRNRGYQRELERDFVITGREAERTRRLLRRSAVSLEQARLETVHKLSLAVEMRDEVTGEHLVRMSSYCEELSRRLEPGQDTCEQIGLAAQMHDIGKVGVPDRILLKRGPLTDAEQAQMETHADIGRRILQGSDSRLMQLAESIAWTHHERVDGTGYPRGLSGEEIPVEGRIAAVADVFDALTRERPYRQAMPLDDALELMAEGRGSHFDPEIFDTFMGDVPALA
jgi:cyclic di-GMP phosphodiesterase